MMSAESQFLESRKPPRWGRASLVAGLLLGGLIIFVFSVDQKLEPFDDLIPPPLASVDPASDGAIRLPQLWQDRPVLSGQDLAKLHFLIIGGPIPDHAQTKRLTAGWDQLVPELQSILAMPHYRIPPETEYGSDLQEKSFGRCVSSAHQQLRAQAALALREGRPADSLAMLRELRRWAAKHMGNSHSINDMPMGVGMLHSAATGTCDWLASSEPTKDALRELSGIWQEDLPEASAVHRSILNLAAEFRDRVRNIQTGPWLSRSPLEPFLPPSGARGGRLYLKPHLTLNRIHQETRWFLAHGLGPSRTKDQSALSRYQFLREALDIKGDGSWWNPNTKGHDLLRSFYHQLNSTAERTVLRSRFLNRAMRLRLALEAWRLDHEGTYPDKLDALVPGYLESLPPDPSNGQAFGWDPQKLMLWASGEDWKPDAPAWPFSQKGWSKWVEDDYQHPGLQLTLPSVPAGGPSRP